MRTIRAVITALTVTMFSVLTFGLPALADPVKPIQTPGPTPTPGLTDGHSRNETLEGIVVGLALIACIWVVAWLFGSSEGGNGNS